MKELSPPRFSRFVARRTQFQVPIEWFRIGCRPNGQGFLEARLLRRWICSTQRVVKLPKFIVLLLLLNLGVVAGILVYVFRPSPPLVDTSESVGSMTLTPPSPEPSDQPVGKVVVVTNQFHWAQVESEDYKTYIARLRSIGCPEATIRDIIIADLDKLLAPEVAAAQGRRKELKYWHSEEEEMLNDVDPREAFRKQREIDKRKQEIIRELVNADLFRERMKASGQEDYYERRLSFLSEERRTLVREALEKYDEAERKIQGKDGVETGVLSAAERSKLRILRQQREEEIQRLISPEEKKQYDVWLSPTANEVRHSLYGMNASEQEFQAVHQARKAFEETWGSRDPDLLDAATRQKMDAARGDMEGQIEQEFGPERYADYKRGQDDDFHMLNALVTHFKLPREKAAEVYSYKLVANGYRGQAAANTAMSAEQKLAALKDIAEETRKTVAAALGPKAFNHYLRSGQAQWIGE